MDLPGALVLSDTGAGAVVAIVIEKTNHQLLSKQSSKYVHTNFPPLAWLQSRAANQPMHISVGLLGAELKRSDAKYTHFIYGFYS